MMKNLLLKFAEGKTIHYFDHRIRIYFMILGKVKLPTTFNSNNIEDRHYYTLEMCIQYSTRQHIVVCRHYSLLAQFHNSVPKREIALRLTDQWTTVYHEYLRN
jgi:hypothetical protein